MICAAVSPYQATRNDMRHMIGPDEFLKCLWIRLLRYMKGATSRLYAKARQGEIKDFTGIDDPYEPPACSLR